MQNAGEEVSSSNECALSKTLFDGVRRIKGKGKIKLSGTEKQTPALRERVRTGVLLKVL